MSNFCISFQGDTRKGKRKQNQDAFFVSDELKIACITDGMGCFEQSSFASYLAQHHILQELHSHYFNHQWVPPKYSLPHSSSLTSTLAQVANHAVLTAHIAIEQELNMKAAKAIQGGCTVALLIIDGNKFVSCNVGDSRIYLMRNHRFSQLSFDHNYAMQCMMKGASKEEAFRLPNARALTQAVGCGSIKPFIMEGEIEDDDIFFLCSDGVDEIVGAQSITKKVRDINTRAKTITKEALRLGSTDNVTAIIGRITQTDPVSSRSWRDRYRHGFKKWLWTNWRQTPTFGKTSVPCE